MQKSLLNTPSDTTPDTTLTINGEAVTARIGERLIDALNRHVDSLAEKRVPQVCYLPQMGPIESCDTCMVEVDGELVRACGTLVAGESIWRPRVKRRHRATRGIRPDSAKSRTLLHGLR